MPLDAELLSILVCPETRQPVRLADERTVTELNGRIAAGAVKNQAGSLVKEQVQAALVREDGRRIYPVRNDIPVMLVDESIPL